jgi:putative ABC transport system permease protein
MFDDRDRPNTPPVVIVSEAIQRQYFGPGESAVGRQIKLGNASMEIVGVVGNIKRAGLRDAPRPDMYFSFEQNPGNAITLFIRTAADPQPALPALQAALRSIEPGLVLVESQTMAAILSESVQVTHLALCLLGIFAATALALAAVGIYSIMSYVVRQRTREIGTRVALGATRRDIIWLIMRQGAEIAAAGTTIGVAAGLVAARSLASILYGTSMSDPATLAFAAGALTVATLAACYVPARRAAAVDPARTLAEQ